MDCSNQQHAIETRQRIAEGTVRGFPRHGFQSRSRVMCEPIVTQQLRQCRRGGLIPDDGQPLASLGLGELAGTRVVQDLDQIRRRQGHDVGRLVRSAGQLLVGPSLKFAPRLTAQAVASDTGKHSDRE